MFKKAIFCLSLSTIIASAANAQQVTSVFERNRADYDAIGVQVGAFEVKPSLYVNEVFDSNIFLTETDEIDDAITTIKPGLSVASNWTRHALAFNAGGEFGIYDENDDENYSDFNVSLDGRLDVLRETYILLGVKHSKQHQERGSVDNNAGSTEPTEYTITGGNIGVQRQVRRISFDLNNTFDVYDFDDDVTSAGANIDNDDRDRDEFASNLRVSYEITPGYNAFVDGTYVNNKYDQTASAGRDSEGYDVAVGAAVDLGGKTKGEVFVGYLTREYDDSTTFADIDGVAFGAELLWNPTAITSVELGINRSVEETTVSGASGYLSTGYSAEVQHELLRNVLVGANVSYTTNEYEGAASGSEREDDLTAAGFDVKYLFNKNLSLDAGYGYSDRDSNLSGQDYDDNKFTVGFGISL